MAITTRKITTYAKNIKDLSDTPNKDGMTADDLKAFFDGRGDAEIKDSINGIVDDLVAVADGVSGADQIGLTPLRLGGSNKLQTALEELKSEKVEMTTNQTIEGIKTFASSPIVPLPSNDNQSASKKYVDDEITSRKLDNNGDFTGTLNGMPISQAEPGLSTEVVNARGTFGTLDLRLDANDTLVSNISVNVKSFNAKGDGTTDDTAAIQSAINYLNGLGGGALIFGSGEAYCISSTLIIPQVIDIDFKNCVLKPITGGTFLNNYMICINASNGTSWDIAYSSRVGYLKNVTFDNKNGAVSEPKITNLKGILTGSPHKVSNLKSQFLWQTICTTGDYIDNLEWESFLIVNPQGTEYQVRKAGQGDRCRISKMDIMNYMTSDYGYLLIVSGTHGTHIESIVNGINQIYNSSSVTLTNIHCEKGNWTAKDSNFALRDSYFWKDDVNRPITIIDTEYQGGSGNWATAKPSIIENVIFNLKHDSYSYINNIEDVDISKFRGLLKVSASFRRAEPSGAPLNRMPITGISVKTYNSVITLPYNTNEIVNGILAPQIIKAATDDGYYGLNGLTVLTGIAWLEAIGTYQYRAGFIYDSVRMIGIVNTSTPTPSIVLSGTTQAVKLTLGTYKGSGLMRIYRGASAGQYDKYVDVPNPIASMLFDNGKNVQGYIWNARTVGGVDTINNYRSIEYVGESVICYGLAIPTVGAWSVGDRIVKSVPVVGQPKSWVCTVAGTPGTWVSEGNL